LKYGYYVYYRIPAEHTASMRDKALAIFRDVERETGVAGRLMRRRDDAATWMEIYEGVSEPAAFETALAAAVERHAFMQVLAPGAARKNEVFQPAFPSD
jgi:hypothetical protein